MVRIYGVGLISFHIRGLNIKEKLIISVRNMNNVSADKHFKLSQNIWMFSKTCKIFRKTYGNPKFVKNYFYIIGIIFIFLQNFLKTIYVIKTIFQSFYWSIVKFQKFVNFKILLKYFTKFWNFQQGSVLHHYEFVMNGNHR